MPSDFLHVPAGRVTSVRLGPLPVADERSLYALHLGPGLTLYDGPIRWERPWRYDRRGRLRFPSQHRKVRPGLCWPAYRRGFRMLSRARWSALRGWASPVQYERRCRLWFAWMCEFGGAQRRGRTPC